jgi:hypothetical protein
MTLEARRIGALQALRRAGRMDEAIAEAEAWTKASPRNSSAWSILADTLAAANRPDLASGAWDKALTLDPRSVAVMCGKARALQALGWPGEAERWFERALEVDHHAFDARFGLARLAFDAGDLDRADAYAERLEKRPGAAWLSARIAAARGEFEKARALTEGLLAVPALGEAQRAEALLLQATVLDDLGETAPAFLAAREGKAIQRRLFARRAASREGETQKLKRLAAWFSTADRSVWASATETTPGPDAPDTHVFLLGFPRSGTTLLEQALAGHGDVVTLEEAPTLADHYQAFLASAEGLELLAQITPEMARTWRARYWQVVREHGVSPGGRVFVDKAPAGTLNLPVIARLFPWAKILFAVRDPRDVVLSCLLNAFQMNSLTYAFTDLGEAAACYDASMMLAEIYRDRLSLDLQEVRHEALVEDFDGELAAVAAFIGTSFEAAMSDVAWTARRRVVRTPSAPQVREGLNRKGLARWRSYASELVPVRAVLAPWVRRFGYAEE